LTVVINSWINVTACRTQLNATAGIQEVLNQYKDQMNKTCR
jgi:hypothetical protein